MYLISSHREKEFKPIFHSLRDEAGSRQVSVLTDQHIHFCSHQLGWDWGGYPLIVLMSLVSMNLILLSEVWRWRLRETLAALVQFFQFPMSRPLTVIPNQFSHWSLLASLSLNPLNFSSSYCKMYREMFFLWNRDEGDFFMSTLTLKEVNREKENVKDEIVD